MRQWNGQKRESFGDTSDPYPGRILEHMVVVLTPGESLGPSVGGVAEWLCSRDVGASGVGGGTGGLA